MAGPGSFGAAMPPRMDDGPRKQRDLERQLRENTYANTAAATQIGNGGVLTVDGSEIVNGSLTVNGTITTPGTLNSAGAINAGTSMSAGTTFTAGGNIQGAGLISTGGITAATDMNASGNLIAGNNVSASGQVISAGIVNSPGTKANTVTVGYSAVYIDSSGNMGGNTSSRRYKQDITPVQTDMAGFLGLTTYKFRYIAAVQDLGAAAPYEYGLMAEDVVKVAPWACFFEADGVTVRGINYDRLIVSALNVLQAQDARLTTLEARLKAAGIA